MPFKNGDTVYVHHLNTIAKVVCKHPHRDFIGVEFNKKFDGCTSLGGVLALDRGMYLEEGNLTLMKPISEIIKGMVINTG